MTATAPALPTIGLNDGASIPQLGFGTWQVSDEAAFDAALEVGYRSIDTAAIYKNEEGVGRAIGRAIAFGVPREELFVTTKLWNTSHAYDKTMAALDKSLTRLGLDYVDLYLIHWPVPAQDLYVEAWRGLEKLQRDGKARSIGVSNFLPHHLERLLRETDVVPAVNQIELHPQYGRGDLKKLHARHGIVTEAWSPIAQGGDVLRAGPVVDAARRLDRTPAQVVLRWHLQCGHVAIPRSQRRERIAENFAILDFELAADELAAITALDAPSEEGRIGPDPETFR